ncbi:hypothetical protein HRR83_005550 [Exophiala dermatitidis]|uniref:ceramidase n=3 Tax=Exophiala dermatitidis TaxID=5970 RepID=H6BWE8_EXODN|nr:N-acylsphingosine amidohydrolase [Exophiala dermatitidis NIH/UT8656]KAJ4502455.1 hypothetical protein HRR75_008435 [Exophiala dermatitidis]EHY55195.1 N-acylsphingosine amidohydrolase [Exophiala dermatitidis NIH/UT8656]KAJ4503781.1 hypothetical protein HRR74_009172 [Exophiala dermatitidis]KAJ4508178.1 hypothetical protein HRR73_007617 [Exophiala dermatitidis]KAJ4531898.1 hypothetical protein HRR77_009029 [Exophiala dermatitidis]
MAGASDTRLAYTAPKFTIDLSLPPEDRYKALAEAYKSQLQGLTGLFNDLLRDLGLASHYHGLVNRAARLLLRGVHSPIENAELRGIAEVTGVPMYLLVSFNVILDLLMGCTSGAVRCLEKGQPPSKAKMLHFRTLDWTMDPLRSVIVQLEFVRSESANPSEVLARSITYVGFVGFLTGVRQGLSLSLNFRAVHNASTKRGHFEFYFHHLLVLLGYRQSISSLLRSYMISESEGRDQPRTLAEISEDVDSRRTTAAYLTFSDGVSTIVIEKDYKTAKVRRSDTFIAITNHDVENHNGGSTSITPAADEMVDHSKGVAAGLHELIDESRDRLACISSKWEAHVQKDQGQAKRKKTDAGRTDVAITQGKLIEWLSAWPTSNEYTHFAAVLDPATGDVVWTRAYRVPIKAPG